MRVVRTVMIIVALTLLAPGGRAVAAPVWQLTWAVHISLAPTSFDPAETPASSPRS